MKQIMDWRLNSADIKKAIDAVTQFVSDVVTASEPFKVKAKLIKATTETANIELNGETYWINQRYCYFGLQQQEPGSEVYVDNRYIYKL